MIRPLRARHRWMILAAALVAGVVLLAGLALRRSVPPVEDGVLPLGSTRSPGGTSWD